jgi:acyl-CoA synthetase (AMP-forming)/AMP-acid ligase II
VQYIGEILRYVLSTPPSSFDRQHVVRKALGNGLRPEVWKAFQQRFGVDYVGEFYGSTEGNALLINNTNHVGACGYLPRFSYHVYPLRVVRFDVETETPIRGSDGFCQPCAPGEVGELLGRIDSRDATRQFDGYTSHKATVGKICVDAFAKGDAWFR